jgi:hypothetical protein
MGSPAYQGIQRVKKSGLLRGRWLPPALMGAVKLPYTVGIFKQTSYQADLTKGKSRRVESLKKGAFKTSEMLNTKEEIKTDRIEEEFRSQEQKRSTDQVILKPDPNQELKISRSLEPNRRKRRKRDHH